MYLNVCVNWIFLEVNTWISFTGIRSDNFQKFEMYNDKECFKIFSVYISIKCDWYLCLVGCN